jgi:hypothetical protein
VVGGGGAVTGGGAVVLAPVEVGRGGVVVVRTAGGRFPVRLPVLPVAIVAVAVLVEVTGVPQYSYWPCQGVNFGVEVGFRNGTSLRFPMTDPMNRCQIEAGNVGPETAIPCTSSIGISAFG